MTDLDAHDIGIEFVESEYPILSLNLADNYIEQEGLFSIIKGLHIHAQL